ncbi:MAG: hypothetical protein AB2A00_24100 [Myxococcota bacterium]
MSSDNQPALAPSLSPSTRSNVALVPPVSSSTLPALPNDTLPGPDAYLYGRKGPWPQPSPAHPQGESAAVIHLPDDEQAEWNKAIGDRYLKNLLTYWPTALVYALENPHVEIMEDDEFGELFRNSVMSRFLCPKLDPPDLAAFAPFLANPPPGSTFFKADFSAMGYVQPYEGMYIAPSVVLLRRDAKGTLTLVAIRVYDVVMSPVNVNAWPLAKCIALQGATTRLILSFHPNLHFPYDAINAVTKTALPKDHLVFKLLYPHTQYTLVLDNTVLTNEFSVLNNWRWLIYAPFAGTSTGLRNLVVAGHQGIPGNSAYPEFRFPVAGAEVEGPYGEFLRAYWNTFKGFVTTVLQKLPPRDPLVARWADHIAPWVKGFPDSRTIFEGDTLANVITTYMHDVSVAHACDHYDLGTYSINKLPLRLRVPPPASPDIPKQDPAKFMKKVDVFKYKMAAKMFFDPTNVTLLHEVDYNFTDPQLIQANNVFLQALRETEANLKVKNFIPLNQIACSIQY